MFREMEGVIGSRAKTLHVHVHVHMYMYMYNILCCKLY